MTIAPDAVAALGAGLRGHLLPADDAGYGQARTLWNGMIDRRLALIARCLGVADVVACVNFARAHGVLMSIKSGGHNIAGLAWEDPAADDVHMAWARDTWAEIRPFSTGRTYVNFLNAEEGEGRTLDAYRGNHRRLAGVKATYDPDNAFRTHKYIAPAALKPA